MPGHIAFADTQKAIGHGFRQAPPGELEPPGGAFPAAYYQPVRKE